MRTSLYSQHCELGAKIVDFCGWDMPIQYKGIIHEHHVVRNAVGLFDVSHMGRIEVKGQHAESFLDYLCTNKIVGKKDGQAIYSVLCQEDGGCIDDVIVYRIQKDHFFLIVNAGNREKDLKHLQSHAQDLEINDYFDKEGIIAIQGPKALAVVEKLFPSAPTIPFMHFSHLKFEGENVILSATGYTGSGGFEIYAPEKIIPQLWKSLLVEGSPYGIEPIGLGARDTLRLEMGFALYGHELNTTTYPTETVSGWAVKLNKEQFLGKEALLKAQQSKTTRKQYGILLEGKGIAREGYSVTKDGVEIGKVCSGAYSPSLERAIAIISSNIELQEADLVEIKIRKQSVPASIVAIPFFQPNTNI